MPWQLILSAVPVLLLLGALLRYELKSAEVLREAEEEKEDLIIPLARKIQERHQEKYGRACTELDREFPELNQAK